MAGTYGTYTVTTSNVTESAWVNWNVIYPTTTVTTGSITTNSVEWVYWNAQYDCVFSPEKLFTEQQEALRLQQEERNRRQAEIEAKRVAAQKKATELLLENLDAEQQIEFNQHKRFTVHVRGKVDQHYLIEYGYAGNVKLFHKGKAIAKFCIHPAHNLPNEDVMLAQKLLLETNEEQFLKIANKTVLAA